MTALIFGESSAPPDSVWISDAAMIVWYGERPVVSAFPSPTASARLSN